MLSSRADPIKAGRKTSSSNVLQSHIQITLHADEDLINKLDRTATED
jgi:hypothetical protein